MKLRQGARLLLLLLTVAATGVAVLLLAGPWLPVAGPAQTGFAGLVSTACALALLVSWTWLALGTVAVAVETLRASVPRSAARTAWVPRTLRVVVPVLLGAAVSAAPASAGPASAGPDSRPSVDAPRPSGCLGGALTGLRVPDRALTTDALRPAGRPPVHTVLVRPGDTLWSITEGLLPAGSAPAVVDRGWRRVAGVNADLVPDPHLIRPGTRLRVPPMTVHPREEAR